MTGLTRKVGIEDLPHDAEDDCEQGEERCGAVE
jgi:hypothetical protein